MDDVIHTVKMQSGGGQDTRTEGEKIGGLERPPSGRPEKRENLKVDPLRCGLVT